MNVALSNPLLGSLVADISLATSGLRAGLSELAVLEPMREREREWADDPVLGAPTYSLRLLLDRDPSSVTHPDLLRALQTTVEGLRPLAEQNHEAQARILQIAAQDLARLTGSAKSIPPPLFRPMSLPPPPLFNGVPRSTSEIYGPDADPWLRCAPEMSSRLLITMLRLFEQRYGNDRLTALVGELGTTLEVLRDPDRWFSAKLLYQLNVAMADSSGDKDLTYKAGLAFPKMEIMGLQRVILRNIKSLEEFFTRAFIEETARVSRITTWKAEMIGPNTAQVTFSLLADGEDYLCFCDNRRGILEAIPQIWGLPNAEVSHTRCIHRGDDDCVYEVKWKDRPSYQRIQGISDRVGAGLLAGVAALGIAGVDPLLLTSGAVAIISGMLLVNKRGWRRLEADTAQWETETAAEARRLVERHDRLYGEARRQLMLAKKLDMFLPPHAVKEILSDPFRALELGGRLISAAIMFCDVAGFTEMSGESTPIQVTGAMNLFFGVTDPILKRHGGFVDKRIGDCVMAVFPDEYEESDGSTGKVHPVIRAINAGVEMHQAIPELRKAVVDVAPAFSNMDIHGGIHFGKVVAGYLGSEDRMECTVIGTAVNEASRVEGQARKGTTYVSGEALEAADALHMAELVQTGVVLKGVKDAVDLYSIIIPRSR